MKKAFFFVASIIVFAVLINVIDYPPLHDTMVYFYVFVSVFFLLHRSVKDSKESLGEMMAVCRDNGTFYGIDNLSEISKDRSMSRLFASSRKRERSFKFLVVALFIGVPILSSELSDEPPVGIFRLVVHVSNIVVYTIISVKWLFPMVSEATRADLMYDVLSRIDRYDAGN